ncbi:hypothetical protein HHI36_010262 [Cryptolaemus montrouzieri]|uniref:Uncharacterized protein n=1 Tax=Cryptolaemus montrouzieri TaxID=559131 RepID=A0ABD2MI54_9CUCU
MSTLAVVCQTVCEDLTITINFRKVKPHIGNSIEEIVKRNTEIELTATTIRNYLNNEGLPENTIDFHALIETKFDYPDIALDNPNNTAILPFSSGTTGLPKGVQLTHKNLVHNMLQNSHPELKFKISATDSFQEVLPTMLPFYHAFGYSVVMNGLNLHGGKIVALPKFRPPSFISMLKEHQQESTILYLVPPIVLLLTNDPNAKKEYLKNLRIIFTGAAPLAASDVEKFCRKFGDHITFLQGYGLTETSPVVCSLWPSILDKEGSYRGSIGRPVPNTLMKVVDINDPKNTPLGPNVDGEILIKGPQIMKGYLNLPEETKNILTEDGWLRSGDIGHYNNNGYFFISDRLKELIKVKGNQVPPAELEAIVRSFPGVAEAAVIGIPHDTKGEVPRAYVVGKIGEKLDIEALNQYVDDKVAKYKRLKGGIVVMEEIPKSATGKISRRILKEMFLKDGI